MKVLIIEDNQFCAEMMSTALAGEDLDIEVAYTPRAALNSASRFQPDLVISDWDLREETDGVQVCREIKNLLPRSRFLFISGSSIDDLVQASKTLNPLAVIAKPVDIEHLKTHVGAVADMYSQEFATA